MKLETLLEGVPVLDATADLNQEITGVSYDSRQVKPGELFDFAPKPDVFFDRPETKRGDIVTDTQLGTIIEMVSMILDGCKDLDEAKSKVQRLAKGLKTP